MYNNATNYNYYQWERETINMRFLAHNTYWPKITFNKFKYQY